MELLGVITENAMVAAFLKGEIDSKRWGDSIAAILWADGLDRSIIDAPNLSNESENNYRNSVLSRYRGYPEALLFEGFPRDMKWERATLGRRDIEELKYIRHPDWISDSGGSRLLKDAANRIASGMAKSPNAYLIVQAAQGFDAQKLRSEPILVALRPCDERIILEGHVRLTAYLLANSGTPVQTIVGYSVSLVHWKFY
jgi:hypothetical protein